MNDDDKLNNGDRLESPLNEAVEAVCAETLPDRVVEGALARAQQLATPPTCSESEESLHSYRRSRFSVARRWIILAACVALLAVPIFWSIPTNPVLAEVVKEVAKQAWMHATGKGPNDIDIEIWYSPQNGIVATRQRKDVVFVNVPQETIEVYENTGEGTPYLARLPIANRAERTLRFPAGDVPLLVLR